MSTLTLKDLSFIKDLNRTNIKTTQLSEITLKSSIKEKVVVKIFSVPEKKINFSLLARQLQASQSIKEINTMKKAIVDNQKKVSRLVIIQQYQQKGKLTEMITQKWRVEKQLLINVALGIKQLHSNKIQHLNLKPENIFISGNKIKFTDIRTAFLNALFRKNKLSEALSAYDPPNSQQSIAKTKQWDIWSLGIIFLQLMIHRRIQVEETSFTSLSKLISTIEEHHMKYLLNGMLCEKNSRFSIDKVIEIIRKGQSKVDMLQNKSHVLLKLPIYDQKLIDNVSSTEIHQTFSLSINNWLMSIHLLSSKRAEKLLLTASCTQPGSSIRIYSIYEQIPQSFNQLFSCWKECFEVLKFTQPENYRFNSEGNLCIYVCEKKLMKKQRQNTQKREKLQQQMKKKTKDHKQKQSISKKSQEIEEQKKEISEKMNPAYLREADYMKRLIKDEDLTFQSDQQINLSEAHKLFPSPQEESSKKVAETLKIIAKASNQETSYVSVSYEQLGNLYEDEGQLQLAKRAYKIARHGYQKYLGKDSEKQMNLLLNLGNVFAKQKENQRAKKCYKRCIFIAEKKDDAQTLSKAYKNWGNLALLRKKLETAKLCYMKSIEFYSRLNNQEELCIAYTNLSTVYLTKEEWAKSNDCIKEYLKLNNKNTDQTNLILHFNWGFGLINLNQFKQAFTEFHISFQMNNGQTKRRKMEQVFLDILREKKQAIKEEHPLHKEQLIRLQNLLSPKHQNIFKQHFSQLTR